MPFVFDQTEIEWPDDESDPPPPRPNQFVYLPPPEFGGAREPVHFTLDIPPEPLVPGPVAPVITRPSLWDRLWGRRLPTAQVTPAVKAAAEVWAAREVFTRQRLIAVSVPALRELGVQRLYCRYDGGNDEGFSWLDSATLHDGTRVDADALAQRLTEQRFLDRLVARGVMNRIDGTSERDQIASFVRDWMCTEWATLLLGRGYGTGEYVMYGAFVVDLDALSVVDDPRADPVTSNIEIAR